MSNITIALLLTALAGLTTILGTVMLFFVDKNSTKILSAGLGFSAGAMILVSFIEIYPNALEELSSVYSDKRAFLISMASFFGGMLIIALIDKVLPEDDANPHELYSEEEMEEFVEQGEVHQSSKLYKMGLFTALAIAIHNFPEGIATFMTSIENPSLGLPIAIAIAIHNIPEGMSVALPIYYATGSKSKAFFYSFISGIAEPIGGLAAYLIFFQRATAGVMGIILAAVAGIMVFISLDQLLPAAEEYGNHHLTIYGCIGGMAFMALSLILLA